LVVVEVDLFVENVKFIDSVFPNPRKKVCVCNWRFGGDGEA